MTDYDKAQSAVQWYDHGVAGNEGQHVALRFYAVTPDGARKLSGTTHDATQEQREAAVLLMRPKIERVDVETRIDGEWTRIRRWVMGANGVEHD